MVFAKHYAEAQILFDERNKILRWKIVADLSKFGGDGIEVKQKNIPIIENPYENIDWDNAEDRQLKMKNLNSPAVQSLKAELGEDCVAVSLCGKNYANAKTNGMLFQSGAKNNMIPPEIFSIEVDNYQGTITVESKFANKIEWLLVDELIKTKFNYGGKFITSLKVENLDGAYIRFKLTGNGGQTSSQAFGLGKVG